MLYAQLIALVLATTTLAASGCGGSSKTTSSPTGAVATTPAQPTTSAQTPPAINIGSQIKIRTGTPLTHAAWITKGDAVCTRIDAKLEEDKNSNEQDLARDLPHAAADDRLEAAELSQIVPPTAMATDWSQIVNDIQKFGAYTEKAAEYAKTGKFSEASTLVVIGNSMQKKFTNLAKRDGFKVCSIA